ncbi:MAG: DUF5655 domain-containing protein [Acidobacteriota bacterium]
MSDVLAKRRAAIEAKTGKTLVAMGKLADRSGLVKHGELRDFFKQELGLGHGDANVLVHLLKGSDGESQAAGVSTDDVEAALYAGPKAHLKPIHDKVMRAIQAFGAFEIAPKKGYLSLRRKKQFAMLGPATNTRVEVGLNIKGLPGTDRLVAQPAGGMCQHKIKLTHVDEVDRQLVEWIRAAYEGAG